MPKFRRSNQKISRWWKNNVFFSLSRMLHEPVFTHLHLRSLSKHSNLENKAKKTHTTSEYVWQFHPFFLIRRTSNSAMFLFLSIQAKRDRTHILLLLLLRVFYFLFINYTVYRSRIVQLFAYMCRSERARVLLFRMHNVMYDICVHIFIVILCCGVRHQLATVQRRMIRHICKF